ncbi:hypothetical protein CUJ90_18655 [Paraburkholderia terricola]|nr:hypothetical protein CUJ90_18655 [Paraburkholderia terricola]
MLPANRKPQTANRKPQTANRKPQTANRKPQTQRRREPMRPVPRDRRGIADNAAACEDYSST